MVAILTAELARKEDDKDAWIVNCNLVDALVALEAVESAPVIEAAFAADVVDESYCGGWATGVMTSDSAPSRRSRHPAAMWRIAVISFPPPKPKRPDPKKLLKKAKSRNRR